MRRALPLALLFTLAPPACAREQPPRREHTVGSAAEVPDRTREQPSSLPALERARLEYLFQAAARVARIWPQLAADETCLLLIGQAVQWVVHCDEAPSGFAPTAEQLDGRPIFEHAGDSFESEGKTRSTAELLAQTPAAAHVFGPNAGKRQLPGRRPWLLLGTLEALRSFHPAFGPATTEHWLSVAIHEFLHIHQWRQPAFASYAERITAGRLHPAAISDLYQRDPAFRAQIGREYLQLTTAAAGALEPEAARRAVRSWLRSYRDRSARVARRPDGASLLQDDRLFTYVEGVARFVESEFLVDGAQHPPGTPSGDPQFHHFEAFLGRGYAASPNRQLDAQYYYAIGYHLCVLLERIDPSWKQRVDTHPGWVIGLAEEIRE